MFKDKNLLIIIAIIAIAVLIGLYFLLRTTKEKADFNLGSVLSSFTSEDNYQETLELNNTDEKDISSFIKKRASIVSNLSNNYYFKDERGAYVNNSFIGIDFEFINKDGSKYIKYNNENVTKLISDEIPVGQWLPLNEKYSSIIPGIDDMLENFNKEQLRNLVKSILENKDCLQDNNIVDETKDSIKYDISKETYTINIINSMFRSSINLKNASSPITFEVKVNAGKLYEIVIEYKIGKIIFVIEGYGNQVVEKPTF